MGSIHGDGMGLLAVTRRLLAGVWGALLAYQSRAQCGGDLTPSPQLTSSSKYLWSSVYYLLVIPPSKTNSDAYISRTLSSIVLNLVSVTKGDGCCSALKQKLHSTKLHCGRAGDLLAWGWVVPTHSEYSLSLQIVTSCSGLQIAQSLLRKLPALSQPC